MSLGDFKGTTPWYNKYDLQNGKNGGFFMAILSYLFGLLPNFLTEYLNDYLPLKYRRKKSDILDQILDDSNSWSPSDRGNRFHYERDPDYSIVIGKPSDTLSSRFKKFPDRSNDRIAWVSVRYKDMELFGWNFMHLDGFRNFLPVPRSELDLENKYYDFYDLFSKEIRLYRVIGYTDISDSEDKIDNLKRIANILDISLTNL